MPSRRQFLKLGLLAPIVMVIGPMVAAPVPRKNLIVLRIDKEITAEQADVIKECWQWAAHDGAPIVLGPHIKVEQYGA